MTLLFLFAQGDIKQRTVENVEKYVHKDKRLAEVLTNLRVSCFCF